jgi:hypothetical protein
MLLDKRHITHFPQAIDLAPHLAALLLGLGITYRFIATINVDGHSRFAGEGIFWDEPKILCALEFARMEDHAKAQFCFA